MALEVELKSVVDDVASRRVAVERRGAALTFIGQLEDRRYDTPERALTMRDHVLRMRVYRTADGARAELDWKGPTRRENGYKLRDELEAGILDADVLATILTQIGYVVTNAIDREIVQYELGGAMIRFETYPRMDDLVEVEGTPEQIEHAIAALGLPREGFTSERLTEFALRFQERTGMNAALSQRSLLDNAQFEAANA